MRVLITDKYNSLNPFNRIISNELYSRYRIEVSISFDDFWKCEPSEYDVLHLQWPEHLFDKNREGGIVAVEKRLQVFRDSQIPIVITHHNSLPHLWAPSVGKKTYTAVYNLCDVVIHLTEHSLGSYEFSLRSDIREVVIPHHCYLLSEKRISKAAARLKLGITSDANMYLVPGSIRNKTEGTHIIDAFNQLKLRNKFLTIPAWEAKINFQKPLKHPLNTISYFSMKFKQLFPSSTRFGLRKISDEEMNVYLSATDALIVPRVGLNSGVFYLGLAYGIPMICANNGNTGALAKEYENTTYEYGNVESLLLGIRKHLGGEVGQANLEYASTNHSLSKVAGLYKKLYYDCI